MSLELNNNKKKPIKLCTWKRGGLLLAVLLLVSAFMVYRDYKAKDYFDWVANVPPFVMGIVILVAVVYWANRPEK